MSIHEIPLVRIAVPFIAGILIETQITINVFWSIAIAICMVSLLFVFHYLEKFRTSYKYRYVFGLSTSVLIIVFGALLTKFWNVSNSNSNFGNYLEDAEIAYVKVVEATKEKENSVQAVVQVQQVNEVSTIGKSNVYFEKDEQSRSLCIGDILYVQPNFQKIQGPKNPGEFNYKGFLQNRSIHHQLYVTHDQLSLIRSDKNSVRYFANQARKKLLSILKQSGLEDKQFGVASALLLGSKDDLDYDLMKSYARAGAMHVLAVSGLHVGIIYLILTTFLSFLDNLKRGKLIKAILLILALWVYAMITGLSPSVMRAATMFSFVIVGDAIQRKTNIYNTLAASALLLLVINPFLIFEVGFQLSYLAVLGIVYFQPKIYRLIYTKWWLLDKIWAITAVSIAAQIATLPLTLYYFHQFPTYFMLANIIVIPLATVILGLGILILITSPIHFVSEFLGWLLNEVIWMVNTFVEGIQFLPYSIIKGISISRVEVFLLFAVIVFIIIGISYKRLKWINWSLLIFLSIILFDLIEDFALAEQNKIVSYSINKESSLDFIHGRKNYFASGDELRENQKKMDFHIHPNWYSMDIEETKYANWNAQGEYFNHSLFQDSQFFQFQNKRIARISDKAVLVEKASKFKTDYLLISDNPKIKIKDLYKAFDFEYLVLDGSNKSWYQNKMILEAEELNIDVFNLSENGFLEIELNELTLFKGLKVSSNNK